MTCPRRPAGRADLPVGDPPVSEPPVSDLPVSRRPSGGPPTGGPPGRPRVLLHERLDPVVAASLRFAAAGAGAEAEVMPALHQDMPARVALLAAPCIDGDGRVLDDPRLAQAAHARGAMLLVDAGMAAGAVPLDVGSMGADAVIADTHRWLLGPEAVAVAWLGPTLGEGAPTAVRAVIGPFGRGPLLALARSVGWLLMYVDLPWVLERTGRLARRLRVALEGDRGRRGDGCPRCAARRPQRAESAPRPRGSPRPRRPRRAGTDVAFRIRGWTAEPAADELSRSVYAILEADADMDLLRASVGAWNREEELDRFTARVAALAAHTPETLPRRPSLVVLRSPGEDA